MTSVSCIFQRRKYTRAKGKTAPKKYNFAPDITKRGAKNAPIISSNNNDRAANSHGFAAWHTLLHVFTRSHATHPISHAKKNSDLGPRRVRSFSNSPTVDSAKERICNAGFTPGRAAPRTARRLPSTPLLKLCVVHMGCDAPRAPRQGLHRWFRRWVYFLRSARAYRTRKHTEKWF